MLIFIPTIIISSLIISADPNQPTEIIGSAATPDGPHKEVIVEQPQNAPDPFGTIAPTPEGGPTVYTAPSANSVPTQQATPSASSAPKLLVSQSSTTNPEEMSMNPLDYQNKIENTIYKDGNRLLDVQSVPIKDISSALTPNIQPTISDYPAW